MVREPGIGQLRPSLPGGVERGIGMPEGSEVTLSAAGLTVIVNGWLLLPRSFMATMLQPSGNVQVRMLREGMSGVPLMVAVPSPTFLKVKPAGIDSPVTTTGVGDPVVVTVKVAGWPAVNTALFGDVISGTEPTV